jgi:hypothetical protein
MQNIGYDQRNFLIAMGTISFVLVLLLIKIVIAFVVKIFLVKSKNQFGGIKFYKILVKNLFFNIFLKLAFEVFMEMIIKGY